MPRSEYMEMRRDVRTCAVGIQSGTRRGMAEPMVGRKAPTHTHPVQTDTQPLYHETHYSVTHTISNNKKLHR